MVGDGESEVCEFRGGVVGRREEKESFAPHPKRAIDVSTATRGRVLMSPPPHWFTVGLLGRQAASSGLASRKCPRKLTSLTTLLPDTDSKRDSNSKYKGKENINCASRL